MSAQGRIDSSESGKQAIHTALHLAKIASKCRCKIGIWQAPSNRRGKNPEKCRENNALERALVGDRATWFFAFFQQLRLRDLDGNRKQTVKLICVTRKGNRVKTAVPECNIFGFLRWNTFENSVSPHQIPPHLGAAGNFPHEINNLKGGGGRPCKAGFLLFSLT